MKKYMLVLLMTALLTVGMTACGDVGAAETNSSNAASAEAESKESSSQASSAETVEDADAAPEQTESTPEPVEMQEEVLSYAQEHGFRFSSETSYHIPAYSYLADANNMEVTADGVTISGIVDDYRELCEVTVSSPDENGMVRLFFRMTDSYQYRVTSDATKSDAGIATMGCNKTGLWLCDLYSGYATTVNVPYMDGDTFSDEVVIDMDVTYAGETYPIRYTGAQSRDTDVSGWRPTSEANIYENIISEQTNYRMQVTMPADYDGLCLAFCVAGATEAPDNTTDSERVSGQFLDLLLLDGERSVEDYVFIRLSELAVNESK